LGESDIADVATLFVNATAAARTSEAETTFADGRENGVSVAAIEERSALTGVTEEFFGFSVFVGEGL